MPGVLIIEAMAQAGAVLLLHDMPDRDSKLVYFTGIDGARFRRTVVPGDQFRFDAGGAQAAVPAPARCAAGPRSTASSRPRPRSSRRWWTGRRSEHGRGRRIDPRAVVRSRRAARPGRRDRSVLRRRRRTSRLGDRCRLESHVVIEGDTELGPDNVISPMVSLGGPPQDLKYARRADPPGHRARQPDPRVRDDEPRHGGRRRRHAGRRRQPVHGLRARGPRLPGRAAGRSSPTRPRWPATSRSATTPPSAPTAGCTSSAAWRATRSSAATRS